MQKSETMFLSKKARGHIGMAGLKARPPSTSQYPWTFLYSEPFSLIVISMQKIGKINLR